MNILHQINKIYDTVILNNFDINTFKTIHKLVRETMKSNSLIIMFNYSRIHQSVLK